MKPSFHHFSRRGAALVLTLGAVVILVIFAIGFLVAVTATRTSTALASRQVFTESLANSVQDVVKSQIEQATASRRDGADILWTSQPGAIRTFGANGAPVRTFKLYSSSDMAPASFDQAADVPSSAEAANRAVWSDINRPAFDTNGVLKYPVLPPPLINDPTGGIPTDVPSSPTQEGVKGYSVDAASVPGFGSSAAAGPENNPASMYVRWLYVLADGRMVAPTVASNTAPGTASVAGATAGNPIVGRVAFWTDDETAKVNINTASEGVFWDVPRANTATERRFSSLQPVINEFQRFPGHPAMTSLSPVLGSWLPTGGSYSELSDYYSLSPRVNDRNASGGPDGTLGGTRSLADTLNPIAVKQDRLYTSGQELLFSAQGTQPTSPTSRLFNAGMAPDVASKLDAFLTTSSRSPELNPFGQPKITIWPLRPTGAASTAQEQLINFASTIGPRRYGFVRANSRSPSADVTTDNLTLLNYLRALTSRNLPGWSNGTFESKYTASERDQILVTLFDFIRSSVPLVLWGSSPLNFTSASQGNAVTSPAYQVTPIRISLGGTESKGMGSFHTLSELNVLFYAYDDPAPPARRLMQAVVIPHFFFPHIGYTAYTPFNYRIQGLSGIQFNVGGTDYPLGPANASSVINARPWFQKAGLPGGGLGLAANFINDAAGGAPRPLGSDPVAAYPFYSAAVPIPSDSAGTFELKSGTITVEISDRFGNVIQTVQVPIPATTETFPTPATNASTPTLTAQSPFLARITLPNLGNDLRRLYYPGDVVVGVGLDPSGPTRGDIRLAAGLAAVPANYFAPLPATGPDSRVRTNIRGSRLEEILLVPSGNPVAGLNNYHLNPNFSSDVRNLRSNPLLPPGVDGVLLDPSNAPGDWTSSMSNYPDMAGLDYPDAFGSNAAAHFDLQSDAETGLASSIFYAPNRSMPSPMIFGSLPTGIQRRQPWQTLLFSPVSASAMSGIAHPGEVNPPDHLWLEFFRMPQVQPYAMSDRFSTNGKINLNYRMLPFSHLRRATGIHALLQSSRIYAVPDANIGSYKLAMGRADVSGKTITNPASPSPGEFRLPVDVEQTLNVFEQRFNANNVFRTASEICEIPLYPQGTTWNASGSNIENFWSQHRLTGDNMRENPYRDLYGRVTVQSNNYTVYYTVQALQKPPGGNPAVWDESRDVVEAELRGSATLERFITNDDSRINSLDFATDPAGRRLDEFYQFRTISGRRFAP